MSISDAYLRLVYSGRGVGKLFEVMGWGQGFQETIDKTVVERSRIVLHLKGGGVFIFNW